MFGLGTKKKAKEPAAEGAGPEQAGATETLGGLKVKVTERKGCQVTLSVQVPGERLEEATGEAFRKIRDKARIPGFRPGKAPMDLIKKNFETAAREEALDRTLRQAVYEALQEEKLLAVAVPVVDKVQHEPGKPLRFDMKVECEPDVALKTYKNLALEKPPTAVSEADIDKRLNEVRESNARLAASEAETVGDAHFVIVDYAGFVDGKPLEGSESQGQVIDMTAPQTVAGFAEGLRGAKRGETREVPVAYPADHPQKDLAGKAAVFKVTVQDIKEKRVPALDDDFAKDVGCDNVADLRGRIGKGLERERSRAARQALEKQISDQLLALNAFDVPPSLVEERTKHLNARLRQYVLQQGASEADWKANEDKMAAKNRVEAERQLRLSYILSAVAKAETLDVAEAEVEAAVQKSMEGVEPAKRADFQKWMETQIDNLRAQLLEEKIFSFLIENAKGTEKGASPV